MVQATFQSASSSPNALSSLYWTLTAGMVQNERSSCFPPSPNGKRSNCSTALRHSPKHSAEPGRDAPGRTAQKHRMYNCGTVLRDDRGHAMTSSSLDETQLPKLRNSQQERVGRRVAELFDNDAQFRAAAPIPEVIEAACTPGLRLTQVLETIVGGYADRPALGQRARELVTDAGTGRTSVRLSPRFDTITYREFWDRVRAIASAWRHDPANPATAGDVVATIGFASADY